MLLFNSLIYIVRRSKNASPFIVLWFSAKIHSRFVFCLRIIKSNLIKTNINILKNVKANMFRKTTEKNHRSI